MSCKQVLLSRMAAKLGSALQPQHTAAAAAVLAAAAGSVSAQLPQLPQAARRDIAAAVLSSPQHRRLVKSVLHAIVAGSSRCDWLGETCAHWGRRHLVCLCVSVVPNVLRHVLSPVCVCVQAAGCCWSVVRWSCQVTAVSGQEAGQGVEVIERRRRR